MRRLLAILVMLLLASSASAKMTLPNGATDVTTYFVLRTASDGTATTGATITSIDLQYVEQGVAPSAKVDATALAATDSIHAANKAIEIDATDQPGLYRVDWPDAAFDGGVGKIVILSVKLASSFTEHLLVELSPSVDVDMVEGSDASTYFETRTLAAADYFLFGSDTVANVTAVGSVSGAVASVAGNVDGNVTGSVGDLLKISGDATAANNLELAFDGTGFGFTNCTMPTVTTTGTATAVTTVNGLAANVITAASIANNAIGATEIADAAIDNATFAADVGTTVYASNHIALATRKALDDYDPPTDTEMLAAHTTTDALINGIDDNPWDAGARTLTAATNLTALITDYNLDHLVKSAVDTNLQTTVHDNSVVGYMLASVNVSAFVRTDDSLQALEGGIAGVADPWSTALPGAYGVGTAGYILGTNLDASITSRTLAAADYFLFGSDTVANVTAVSTVATLTGHTVQTGDSYARLGAPAGASVSADVAAIKAETVTILADTNELQTDLKNGGRLDLMFDLMGNNINRLMANP